MKERFLLFLTVVVAFQISLAQEVCIPKDTSYLEDINTISKCTVEYRKKSDTKKKSISFTVKKSKVRYLKKRIIEKTTKNKKYSTNLNALGYKKINDTSLSLSLKNNLKDIAYNISKKEIKEAISFASIENIPLFSSCKNSLRIDRKDCFNQEMSEHLKNHFEYPQEAVNKRTEGFVSITFIIDKNGYVTNIETTGSKNLKLLKEEARRVITKLPKFIPGKERKKEVNVKYTFPINFKLN